MRGLAYNRQGGRFLTALPLLFCAATSLGATDPAQTSYVRQQGDTVFAGNSGIELQFYAPTGRVTGLIDKATGYNFIAVPNFWGTPFNLTVTLNGSQEYPSAGNANKSSIQSERTQTGMLLRFTFANFRTAAGRVLDISVTYTIDIPDTGSLTYWRISVTNHEDLPVESVGFPTIAGLGAIGSDPRQEFVAYPTMTGILYRDPVHNLPLGRGILADYPSSFATMQFAAYYSGERKLGLYLAAHDPNAHTKNIQILKPQENWLLATLYTPLPLAPHTDYQSGYPVALGVLHGDWYDAATLYREWALGQAWVQAGPLATRADPPVWFTRLGLYQWLYTRPFDYEANPFSSVPQAAADARAAMGSPVAIDWIGWEREGWYAHWPDVFPPKEGWPAFERSIADTHASGNRIFFIANVGSQSSIASNWEEAKPWAVRLASGEMPSTSYSEQTERDTKTVSTMLTTMCPATAYWKSTLTDVLLNLASRGADIVQLDGFPVNQPSLCVAPNHSHPRSGGNWWAQGYLDTFRQVKERAAAAGTPLLFSAEGVAEPYLSILDSYWDPGTTGRPIPRTTEYLQPLDTELIPLWNAVYHEYAIAQAGLTPYAGTGQPLNQPSYYVRGMGLALVWGEAPVTWYPSQKMSQASDPDVLRRIEYLRRIVQARSGYASRFLVHGQMLRQPKLRVPSFTIPETGPIPYSMTMYPAFVSPTVLASAWKAPNADIGIILTNIGPDAVSFDLPLGDVLGGGIGAYTLSTFWNGIATDRLARSDSSLPLELAPMDVVAVVLTPHLRKDRPHRPMPPAQ